MSYAVVCFVEEDDSFSEVPVTWLTPLKTKCYWPNVKNPTQFMTKNTLPMEGWTLHKIRIEGLYNSLEKARKVAQFQDYTSSEELPRIRKHPKRKVITPELSSGNESDVTPPPSPGINSNIQTTHTTTVLEPVLNMQEAINSDIIFVDFHKDQEFENVLHLAPGSEIAGTSTSSEDLKSGNSQNILKKSETFTLEKIYKLQIENNLLLRTIAAKLEKLELPSSTKISTETFNSLREKIPLHTFEELAFLEEKLCEAEFNFIFLKFIKGIGGSSGKDFIHRSFRAVYSNHLAVMCSWLGLRGNYKISSTTSMNMIKAITKEIYPLITDKDFEKIGSEWFRLAKLRLTKKPL